MSFKSHNLQYYALYKANIESHILAVNKYYKQDI